MVIQNVQGGKNSSGIESVTPLCWSKWSIS